MLFAAVILSFVMAAMSAINERPELWRGPPDEYGHHSAARYYVHHWLPPRVGDPASLDSYSRDYGFSYLNDTDPAYFFAGKFAALASPVVRDPDRAFRYFNVALLLVLAFVCLRRTTAYPLFLPLVVTPQVWYIFSYFNGDAFGVFLATLTAYEVCVPESLFLRYLDEHISLRTIGGALLMGALLALLALSKKNFLAFVAFVPAWVAWSRLGATAGALVGVAALGAAAQYLGWVVVPRATDLTLFCGWAFALLLAIFARRTTRRARAIVVLKLAALVACIAAVALPRYYWDSIANGSFEKQRAAIIQLQQKLAKPAYKPSEIYSFKPDAYPAIEMRARGVPLRALFEPPWLWHSRTFATATGTYGWLQFAASKSYFVAMATLYVAIGLLYAWAVLRSRRAWIVVSFVLAASFAVLMVAIDVFYSWTHDFQAQGRYLFPIAAMAGAGLYAARDFLARRALLVLTAGCFVLSVYSFVFIGLAQVPRSFPS